MLGSCTRADIRTQLTHSADTRQRMRGALSCRAFGARALPTRHPVLPCISSRRSASTGNIYMALFWHCSGTSVVMFVIASGIASSLLWHCFDVASSLFWHCFGVASASLRPAPRRLRLVLSRQSPYWWECQQVWIKERLAGWCAVCVPGTLRGVVRAAGGLGRASARRMRMSCKLGQCCVQRNDGGCIAFVLCSDCRGQCCGD